MLTCYYLYINYYILRGKEIIGLKVCSCFFGSIKYNCVLLQPCQGLQVNNIWLFAEFHCIQKLKLPYRTQLAYISRRAEPRCIIIHSTVTIITSNKHNYSHGLHSLDPGLKCHAEHTYTHTLFVSAPCTPHWLLVHSDKCGAEAQR